MRTKAKIACMFIVLMAFSACPSEKVTRKTLHLTKHCSNQDPAVFARVCEQVMSGLEMNAGNFNKVSLSRLGAGEGSAVRSAVMEIDFPEPPDCEAIIFKDAPASVKIVKKAHDDWLEKNRHLCAPTTDAYKAQLRVQLARIREELAHACFQAGECLPLTEVAKRVARDVMPNGYSVVLTTGILQRSGCPNSTPEPVALPDGVRQVVVQLPLNGPNQLHDKRTAQINTVFAKAKVIPAANADRLFTELGLSTTDGQAVAAK